MQRLPGTCQVCGSWPAQPVCPACEAHHAPPDARCPQCARRLPAGTQRCGSCLAADERHTQEALHTLVAAVDYGYPWDGLIARFKFRNEPGWAGPLAALMLRQPRVAELLVAADLMAPIPVSAARLAERGYNQAWELIKALRRQSAWAAVPALAEALVRVGQAPDQHPLPREQRLHNVQGSFMAHPQHVPGLRGLHVLLVDDVCTTGATLASAARALRHAGAGRVSALVLARTSAD